MAFIKRQPHKGFLPEYWNITTLQDNKADGTTRATVSLYKDEQTRHDEPGATLDTLTFTIQGTDHTRAAIYPILKTINPDGQPQEAPYYFEDATDC